MNEQHTPSPWSIYDDSDPLNIKIKGTRPDIGGVHIATVLGEANARAILALPELVKALEMIARTTFSGKENDDSYIRGNSDAHEFCALVARAALAKVKQP